MVLAANVIDKLIGEGHLLAGSRVDLVKSGDGSELLFAKGAAGFDISSENAIKDAVLARSLSYSTGPSGIYLQQLFERFGESFRRFKAASWFRRQESPRDACSERGL